MFKLSGDAFFTGANSGRHTLGQKGLVKHDGIIQNHKQTSFERAGPRIERIRMSCPVFIYLEFHYKQAFANFAKLFANFLDLFELFVRFAKFSDLFGPVRTCSDLLGPVRTCPHAFGCIWRRSDASGRVRKISEILVRKIRFLHFWKGF